MFYEKANKTWVDLIIRWIARLTIKASSLENLKTIRKAYRDEKH